MTDVLALLDGVRDNRGGNYLARCPAHDDRSPSLSVKLTDDGRTLLHCFAGCDIEQIVGALGLTLADLMPDRPLDHHRRKVRSLPPARDALASLAHESMVVAVIGHDVLENQVIDPDTWSRLAQAVGRIGAVRDQVVPARHRP